MKHTKKPEIEFSLFKFYRNTSKGGWYISAFEITNFSNGQSWCLFSMKWYQADKHFKMFEV